MSFLNRIMKALILGLAIAGLLALLVLVRSIDGFEDAPAASAPSVVSDPPVGNPNAQPQNFLDKSLWKDRIANKPPPAGVDITGEVVYAPVDLAADIGNIKNQLNNIMMNQPADITSAVQQQLLPLVGDALRQNGFPMTDETYGCT
jgi:hypothetical protein